MDLALRFVYIIEAQSTAFESQQSTLIPFFFYKKCSTVLWNRIFFFLLVKKIQIMDQASR